MPGTMGRQFRIGFDFDSASSGMRELLAGVRDSPHSGQWELQGLVHSGLTPMLMAHRADLDGMFAFVGSPAVLAIYRRYPQVIVNLSAGMSDPGLPSVWPDNREIGQLAARHLAGRGLRHFAFAGEHSLYFSRLRREGFEHELGSAGRTVAIMEDLPGRIATQEQWRQVGAGLVRQFKRLPRPCGILAADDIRARMVLCAVEDAGLRVPEDISVIGVNDDESVCAFASPPLSSVHLPWRGIGRAAGQVMHRLLSGRKAPARPPIVSGSYVVERRSTDFVAVADPQIAVAIRHIWATAVRAPMTSRRVADQVTMSRRTLDRRMTAAVGRTASEEIARVRQERTAKLLHETDWPIKRIALEMGFRSPEELARFFRHRTGISPTHFRKAGPRATRA